MDCTRVTAPMLTVTEGSGLGLGLPGGWGSLTVGANTWLVTTPVALATKTGFP